MTRADLEALYRQYGSLVHQRCERILQSTQAADDALQEVFVRVWRYPSALGRADSKLAFLYRMGERCCFDQLRKRTRRREEHLDFQDGSRTPLAPGPGTEDKQLILRFLERFDDRVQQVAVLHYLDDMSQEEIAEATGWSRQTVHKKIAFLRERAHALREQLFGTGAG